MSDSTIVLKPVFFDYTKAVSLFLPINTEYFWSIVVPPNSNFKPRVSLTLGNQCRVFVTEGSRVKLTAYARKDKDHFESLGTSIFLIARDGGESAVLGIPNEPLDVNNIVSPPQLNSIVTVKGAKVQDLYSTYAKEINQAIADDKGVISGLNRHVMISWEWPFTVPGWRGCKELGSEVPGWELACPWLEWNALWIFGKKSFSDCVLLSEKLDVLGIALSGVAWLNGYDSENRDDTSKPWCAMGTGKDCDDMAADVCAFANSVIRYSRGDPSNLFSSSSVWNFLRHYFDEAFMVAGRARPFGKEFGHMWCELRFSQECTDDEGLHFQKGDRLIVECTSGVCFFGTKIQDTLNNIGARSSSLDVYTARVTCQSTDKSFYYERSDQQVSPSHDSNWAERGASNLNKLPEWMETLSYPAPSPDLDPKYMENIKALSAGPDYNLLDEKLFGVMSKRKFEEAQGTLRGIRCIEMQILPFQCGGAVWFLESPSTEQKSQSGSF